MKRRTGVLLYGPPASGKDTITQALKDTSTLYSHYERMKMGDGRTTGYRHISSAQLELLRGADRIIWENERYGATYVVEKESLRKLAAASIPVVHIGQAQAISAIKNAVPDIDWITVYLWCPRAVAQQRLQDRRTSDLAARLQAWDETVPLTDSTLTLNTARTSVVEAAKMIDACARSA